MRGLLAHENGFVWCASSTLVLARGVTRVHGRDPSIGVPFGRDPNTGVCFSLFFVFSILCFGLFCPFSLSCFSSFALFSFGPGLSFRRLLLAPSVAQRDMLLYPICLMAYCYNNRILINNHLSILVNTFNNSFRQ